MNRLTVLPLLLAAAPTFASDAICAEDRRTEAMFCFFARDLQEAGQIRTAPLYTGGPKEINRSAYTIAANCTSGVMHLKDRKGVSFAGATMYEGTPQSRELLQLFCSASLPKKSRR